MIIIKQNILRISANDITPEQPGFNPEYILFNDNHARSILDFVASLPPNIDTLVVACLHGESRSVAVVSALKYLMFGEPPPKSPDNQYIYDTLLKVAKRRASLDEITTIGIDAGNYFIE